MSKQIRNDAELDRYLKDGQSPLSRVYQQTQSEGPAETTDARILAAARAAVTKPSAGGTSRGVHWWIPASFAATFILGVGIYFVAQQQSVTVDEKVAQLKSPSPIASKTEAVHPIVAAAPPPAVESKPMELARAETQALKKETSKHDLGQASGSGVLSGNTTPARPAAKLSEPMPAKTADLDKLAYSDTLASAPQALAPAPASAEQRRERLTLQEEKAKLQTTEQVRSPERWLEQITALIKTNKEPQAWEEFKKFQQHNPGFTIDPKKYPDITQLRNKYKAVRPITQ